MYNLGPQPRLERLVDPGQPRPDPERMLQSRRPAAPMQIAEGVINLKAEYGYDTNGNGEIDDARQPEWTGDAAAPRRLAPRAGDPRRRARAQPPVRAQRRPERERRLGGHADGVEPVLLRRPRQAQFLMTTSTATPTHLDDTDAIPNNWRYYRYRVYERVIPLRNMLWGTLS